MIYNQEKKANKITETTCPIDSPGNREHKNGSISPAEVLKLVQELYEKEVVTFPRTHTSIYPTNQISFDFSK